MQGQAASIVPLAPWALANCSRPVLHLPDAPPSLGSRQLYPGSGQRDSHTAHQMSVQRLVSGATYLSLAESSAAKPLHTLGHGGEESAVQCA
jgi:hypothetical protein